MSGRLVRSAASATVLPKANIQPVFVILANLGIPCCQKVALAIRAVRVVTLTLRSAQCKVVTALKLAVLATEATDPGVAQPLLPK